MKKIFFLLVSILANNILFAQGTYLYNGTYLYSPFSNYNSSCTTSAIPGGCQYWQGTCFEGWRWATGTPEATPYGGVYMWFDSHNGESICHPYQFNQGDQLTIKLKVADFHFDNSTPSPSYPAYIQVWAVHDIPGFLNIMSRPTPTQCGETPLPYDPDYLSFASAEKLGEYTLNNSVPGASNGGFLSDELLTFTPTIALSGNDYILIMPYRPYDPPAQGNRQLNFTLDWVEVCRAGDGYMHYRSSTIPDGQIVKDIIYAGWPSMVSAQPNKNTELWASQCSLIPNFSAVVNKDHYFLAAAKKACNDNVIISIDENGGSGEKSGVTAQKEISQSVNSAISILPNPSTGSFAINLPPDGNYDIRVANMMGATVYAAKTYSQCVLNVQLDNNMPPGNYSVHITGKGINRVEKIIIAK